MKLEEIFVSTQDTETHRMCGTCNELRPLDAFYKDGKDSHGKIRYRRDCKDCYKKMRVVEANMKKGAKKK